jgi:hypothetical protein
MMRNIKLAKEEQIERCFEKETHNMASRLLPDVDMIHKVINLNGL